MELSYVRKLYCFFLHYINDCIGRIGLTLQYGSRGPFFQIIAKLTDRPHIQLNFILQFPLETFLLPRPRLSKYCCLHSRGFKERTLERNVCSFHQNMHIVTLLATAISVRFQFVLLTTDLFFQKKIGGHQSFCGVTDTPVLDFGDVWPGF